MVKIVLYSSSFKSYSLALSYLGLSAWIGYISVKDISLNSNLFGYVILVFALLAVVKSVLTINSIKNNIWAYIMLIINGLMFLGFTIWLNPSIDTLGNHAFLLLTLIIVMDFITYKIGVKLQGIVK